MTVAPIVIAISGPAGSGKTTIARALAKSLHAPTLFFDDYASQSNLPHDLSAWLENGADFNEWQTPALVSDLRSLKSGQSVQTPDGRTLQSARFIVVENPLGCAQSELADCTDFLIFLDTPLEVALARFVLRELTSGAALTRFEATDEAGLLGSLQMYLQGYLGVFRHVYQEQREQVTQGADLVIDADQPIEKIAETALAAIAKRYGISA